MPWPINEPDGPLDRLARARFSVGEARDELEAAIRYALAQGIPKNRIASAAGVSRTTLYKILREERT